MAQNGIILQEPIFYGPNTPNALSAEDFITRVDSYARTQNWTDQVAATHARMYLRGGPAEHFLEGLQSIDEDEFARCAASYVAFRRHFIQLYFKVSSTGDLSVDYTNLRQANDEDAHTFALRVAAVINRYAKLVNTGDPKPIHVQEFSAPFDVVIARLAPAAAPTPEERQAMAAAVHLLHERGQHDGHRRILNAHIIKTIADGLKSQKLRELVRGAERDGRTLAAICVAIQTAERNLSKKELATLAPTANHRTNGNNSNRGRVAAVSVSDDEDDSADVEVAPIHSKKLKSKKKSTAASQASNSGASKKKEDRPRPWLTATRNTPPPATPCFRCKQTGHWAKFCEAPHPVDEVDDGPSSSNGSQGKANARG